MKKINQLRSDEQFQEQELPPQREYIFNSEELSNIVNTLDGRLKNLKTISLFDIQDEDTSVSENHELMSMRTNASNPRKTSNEWIIPLNRKKVEGIDIFESLNKWEGFVTEVKEDYFCARIKDLTNDRSLEEYVEFSFSEVNEDDIKLINEGAIFYWTIGYHVSSSGQKTRSSLIRFRRLPAWSKNAIDQREKKVNQILRILDSKNGKTSTA